MTYANILIGEVWLCSGQSNMGWSVGNSDDKDLESMSAKHPNLRLISVPQFGSQESQNDFNGQWEETTPETVINFSAVGFSLEENYIRFWMYRLDSSITHGVDPHARLGFRGID